MMTTIIANIVLMVAAVLDLCMILCLDSKMLRQNNYESSRYYKQLMESGEFTSPKRLLAFAVLIGACSTMARMSWIVVLILAAVILAQAIVIGLKIKGEQGLSEKHSKWLYFATIIISMLLIGLTAYFGNHNSTVEASQVAALVALLLLSASPLVIILVNWLLGPITRHNNK